MTNDNNNPNLIISYLGLRKAIGWLGMLLPFILLAGNFIFNKLDLLNNKFFVNLKCSEVYVAANFFKPSISHYYYSTVGELFTGTLIAVAIFMFSYTGHKKRKGEFGFSDNALTNIVGLSALGVVVFPTGSAVCISDNLRTFVSTANSGYIHFTMATIFFVALSFLCIFNFRRTADKVSFGTKKHHNTFRFCGIAMLTCIALIFIYSVWGENKINWLDNIKPIFWLEAIALIFFAISWLIKGQVDLNYLPKLLNLKK
jgi:hypothetical protein